MGYSPMTRTATGPDWTPTVLLDNGSPAQLTGATNFILYIRDSIGLASERTGGGTVTVNNGAAGQITYVWGTLDTSVVGDFYLKFQWTDSAGKIQFCSEVPWEVQQL